MAYPRFFTVEVQLSLARTFETQIPLVKDCEIKGITIFDELDYVHVCYLGFYRDSHDEHATLTIVRDGAEFIPKPNHSIIFEQVCQSHKYGTLYVVIQKEDI